MVNTIPGTPAMCASPPPLPSPPLFVAALLHPPAYPHTVEAVQLRETHISWVFLAGAYAYKIKKPVVLGFVDFSTIERRTRACADEVRLNQRLCRDVYLGVVSIVARADGTFHVGGAGRAIEPAVKMRRLPDTGMLPALIEREAVAARLPERLATHLAHFHATATTGAGVDEWGTPAAIRANWADNFTETAAVHGAVLPTSVVETVRAAIERVLREQHQLLARRVADGYIRDGHGDLHCGNVCIEGRRIQLFDCLEFSPRYRCADVAAEVAFLAMDLTARGRADLAHTFVKGYIRASGDQQLASLLDFYACYRAWVRGKVAALRLAEPGHTTDERRMFTATARRYFTLARAYIARPARPVLVVTLGLPASGKTRLARALAGHLRLLHLSSDIMRKELGGRQPLERREDGFGQGLYRPAMSQRTYAALRRRAAYWLRQGHSVVLDGTFGQPAELVAVRRLAERQGARLILLHCQADDATLRARLAARAQDPLSVSDARLSLLPALRAAFVPPAPQPDVLTLDMGGSFEAALDQALLRIGETDDRQSR